MSGLLLFIETHSQRITSLKVRVMGLNSCYKLTATLKIEIFRHHELTAVLMPYTVIVARFQASSLLLSRCDESQLLRQSLHLMRIEEILCAYIAERNSLRVYKHYVSTRGM